MAKNVLFGFEYETLIEPNENFKNILSATITKIKNGGYDNTTVCGNLFTKLKSYKFPDEFNRIVIRFLLAAFLNNFIQKNNNPNLQKYNFKAEATDKKIICDTFVLTDEEIDQTSKTGGKKYIKQKGGNLQLLNAAKYGNEANIITLLKDHTTNVNIQDRLGWSPLHYAVYNNYQGCVRLLLDAPGININIKNKGGDTPLHIALLYNNEECTRLLLAKGANVNEINKIDNTPLHLAITNGNEILVRLLLAKGANPDVMNTKNKTPRQLAEDNNFVNIVQLLKNPQNILLEFTPKYDHSWAVTYDNSVKREEEEPLYKRIEGRTLRKNISYFPNIEIVSPILTYNDVNNDLEPMINTILPANNTFIYWNGKRTSNHIHLTYEGISFRKNLSIIVKLCMAWWYIEPLILFMMGNWRRNNKFCTPISYILKEKFLNNRDLNIEFIRDKILNNEENEEDILRKAFYQINEMNVFDYIIALGYIIKQEKELEEANIEKLFYVIADFFQGDLSIRETRYAALNLMNICPKGIDTVEFRIKHGSSDGKENKMFMLLLGHLLSAVISKPCITNTFTQQEKDLFFEVQNILQSHPEWNTKTRLKFNEQEQEKMKKAFHIFMDWIDLSEINSIRKYWMKRLNYVLLNRDVIPSNMTEDLGSPLEGGKPKEDIQFIMEINKKGEHTSFGYIDYDKLYKSIEKDYIKYGLTKKSEMIKKEDPNITKTSFGKASMMTTSAMRKYIPSRSMVSRIAGGKNKRK